jgi:hypothetical protein
MLSPGTGSLVDDQDHAGYSTSHLGHSLGDALDMDLRPVPREDVRTSATTRHPGIPWPVRRALAERLDPYAYLGLKAKNRHRAPRHS